MLGLRRAGAWPAAPPGPVGTVGRGVRAFGAPEAPMGRLGYVRGHLVAKKCHAVWPCSGSNGAQNCLESASFGDPNTKLRRCEKIGESYASGVNEANGADFET